MASLHLVTGHAGKAHVTSADQGRLNAMLSGTGEYVLIQGRQFEAVNVSSNTIRVYDGGLLMNGRYVTLDTGTYIDINIASGTSGMKRNDIIYVQYWKDGNTGVESVDFRAQIGTASSATPTDPVLSYRTSLLDGGSIHCMPMYRVRLNGTTIEAIEPLFQALAPMADIQHGFYKQNMLINGDFQCNQRGNTLYNQSSTVGYTVDMWRAYRLRVDVLNEGVKLTATSTGNVGYFTQFVQLGELKTTTYTISAMVDDAIYTFTVTPGGTAKEKDFGNFKISALTTSTWSNDLNAYDNKLKVNICVNYPNVITVKYVDVFEGVVAYPHVKEDPATALMRCRRYVQYNGCSIPPITCTDSTKYTVDVVYDRMANTPMLVNSSYYYVGNNNGSTMDCGGSISETKSISRTVMRAIVSGRVPMHNTCFGMRLTYIVSCEHAPNGD